MDQKTANDELLSRVQDLKLNSYDLESFTTFLLTENESLRKQIVKLHNRNEALHTKCSRQRYVQDWIEGKNVSLRIWRA